MLDVDRDKVDPRDEEICLRVACGIRMAEVARQFKMPPASVRDVCRRHRGLLQSMRAELTRLTLQAAAMAPLCKEIWGSK